MFESLGERLERSFKILKGEGKITEINVAETLKDVRKALLDADVNYKVAKNFTDMVKEKAMGQRELAYEIHPNNPLISSYGHDEIRLQRAGHGAWCKSPDGKKDYLVYLCGRPLPGTERCVLGRETGIAEIEWKDDWPWVKQPDGSLQNFPPDYIEVEGDGEIMPGHGAVHPAEKYTFNNNDFLLDFKTLRVPVDPKRFSTTDRPGWLRIYGGQSPVSTFEQGILCRRQTDFEFEAETKMEFKQS